MAILKYDNEMDELLARGGTFDLTGTDAVIDKQFFGFNATEGTVIAAIKGIPIRTSVANLAAIRAAEIDISGLIVTLLATGLCSGFHRADGYIITSIDLTSGSLHCYKTITQVSA